MQLLVTKPHLRGRHAGIYSAGKFQECQIILFERDRTVTPVAGKIYKHWIKYVIENAIAGKPAGLVLSKVNY